MSKGRSLALVEHLHHPLVRGVAGRVDGAAHEHHVADLERAHVVVVRAARGSACGRPRGPRPTRQITLEPVRWAWHSMLTATGSDAMWVGIVSTWTASTVCVPPSASGPSPSALHSLVQLRLELGDLRVRVRLADLAHERALRDHRRHLEVAADPDADDARRAGVRPRLGDGLEHELLRALEAVGGLQHRVLAHVLRTRTLGVDLDADLVAGHDARVDERRRVVSGVPPIEDGIADDRAPEVPVPVALSHALRSPRRTGPHRRRARPDRRRGRSPCSPCPGSRGTRPRRRAPGCGSAGRGPDVRAATPRAPARA